LTLQTATDTYGHVTPTVEPVYLKLGRRIQQLRVDRGLTQDRLGWQLQPSVTRASIANVESGKQRVLVHTLLQVADILDVDVQDLLPAHARRRDEGARPLAIESELRRKLDLPAEAVRVLAKKLDLSDGRRDRST
jgi:transcriptional regulator with XRE-family HTH domain